MQYKTQELTNTKASYKQIEIRLSEFRTIYGQAGLTDRSIDFSTPSLSSFFFRLIPASRQQ